MATVSAQFAADFNLWATSLLAAGDTPEGVEEIRQAIREAFAVGGETADYWLRRVADEAASIRHCQHPVRQGDSHAS
jgi:hypothetical protein